MIRADLFPLRSVSPELIEATLARIRVSLAPPSGDEWRSFPIDGRSICEDPGRPPPHVYVLRDGRILEPAEAHGLALPFVSETK